MRGPQSFERAMDALHVYVTEREKTDDEHTEYIFRMPEPGRRALGAYAPAAQQFPLDGPGRGHHQ